MFRRKKNPLAQYIKNLLGYNVKKLMVYEQAFVHHSVISGVEGINKNNERLEYLGDAILGAIVADFLYRKYPYADEGFLTCMRSKLVSREHLNKLSRKIELDKFIVIKEGLTTISSSAYGNAFEAFIGAIFIDKGFEKTKQVVIERIFDIFVNLETLEKEDNNYKGKILHYTQKNKQKTEYKVVRELVSPYKKKEYVVYLFIDNKFVSEGRDYTIKAAEQNAAMIACEDFNLE